jgi:hypothetical protein
LPSSGASCVLAGRPSGRVPNAPGFPDRPLDRLGPGSVYDAAVDEVWVVPLPGSVREPFEVYVNGVLQQRGADYAVEGRELHFLKPLAKEGRLGTVRWLSMLLGVAGTYRKNDSVDVVYEVGGRRVVATGLPILPPQPPDAA